MLTQVLTYTRTNNDFIQISMVNKHVLSHYTAHVANNCAIQFIIIMYAQWQAVNRSIELYNNNTFVGTLTSYTLFLRNYKLVSYPMMSHYSWKHIFCFPTSIRSGKLANTQYD